jgi:hypothetical protein
MAAKRRPPLVFVSPFVLGLRRPDHCTRPNPDEFSLPTLAHPAGEFRKVSKHSAVKHRQLVGNLTAQGLMPQSKMCAMNRGG